MNPTPGTPAVQRQGLGGAEGGPSVGVGHRPHGTGFRERFIAPYQPKEPKPCSHCGQPTLRYVWTAVQWVARSEFAVEWTPVCESCEAQRVAAQQAVYRGPG
jgi:hypothetical protein